MGLPGVSRSEVSFFSSDLETPLLLLLSSFLSRINFAPILRPFSLAKISSTSGDDTTRNSRILLDENLFEDSPPLSLFINRPNFPLHPLFKSWRWVKGEKNSATNLNFSLLQPLLAWSKQPRRSSTDFSKTLSFNFFLHLSFFFTEGEKQN